MVSPGFEGLGTEVPQRGPGAENIGEYKNNEKDGKLTDNVTEKQLKQTTNERVTVKSVPGDLRLEIMVSVICGPLKHTLTSFCCE